MAPGVTFVVAVWDEYAALIPRCLRAIAAAPVPSMVVVVDNASEKPIETPANTQRVNLATRSTIGAARNAGLARADTPYVAFADADDEIAPGSVLRSLALLERRPDAVGVIGRSLVDEGRGNVRRGIRPTTRYRYVSRFASGLVPMLWLIGYQGSLTSTVLRTQAVRDVGGFGDANIAEDWLLAARLARRGVFIPVDDTVRIYHRHDGGLRTREPRESAAEQRHGVCADCLRDPASSQVERWLAAALLSFR